VRRVGSVRRLAVGVLTVVLLGTGASIAAARGPTTSPGTTSPGTTSPGTTSPGTTSPGTTVPGTAVPGTSVPEGGRPAAAAPSPEAPDTTAPDTTPAPTEPPTTPVPIEISATSIAVPGYNPEWRSVNPPWVPPVPWFSGGGRRLVYSISQQRAWAVESNGFIVRTWRVSGKIGTPAPGFYSVYSRSEWTFAAYNPSIRWRWMVRFTRSARGLGIGFHEIPTQYGNPVQTIDQLGTPLSGGCVRMATDDAWFVWNWAPVGTPVVVTP
jgi:lipoprotein-anchoring transpeptidase ErfK/SrfK